MRRTIAAFPPSFATTATSLLLFLLLSSIGQQQWAAATLAQQQQQLAIAANNGNSSSSSSAIIVPVGQSSPAAADEQREQEVDIDALLDAVGVPGCIEKCLTSSKLRTGLAQMLRLNNTFDQYQQICQQLQLAKRCVHSGACFTANIFDTVASGLHSICEGPKRQFITHNEACLRRSLDQVNQQCEQKCQLIRALATFSHRSDLKGAGIFHLLAMLEKLGGVCSAADCFLPCFRDGLNSACPRAGGVILDGLLRPFFQLASFIQKGGVGMRKFVEEKVPKECMYLTEKEPLEKLINPNRLLL